MKKGWNIVPMGKLCSISSGESDTQDAVAEGPYAFFDRSRTVKQSNRFLYDCEALIIPGEGKEFLPKHFKGKFDLHQRAYALFDFLPELDVRFLYHLLHYRSDYFPSVAVGATVKSLRRRHFENLPVPVPPLAEQQRIVGILDEAFEAIAAAKAHAEKNVLNALAIFESHTQSVFTQRGVGWEEKRLGEMCERITKGSSPKWQGIAYVDKPGILFVTSENVDEYQIVSEHPKYVEARFNTKDKKSILRKGDVLTNIVGASIGRTAVFDRDDVANINQAVCLIRCEPHLLNNHFLTYLLNSPVFKQVLHDNEVNNARANLSLGFFSQLVVPRPPIAEQIEIVAALDAVREKTERLARLYKRKLAALEALKKSLLHEAFSGALTKDSRPSVAIPFPTRIRSISTTDLHAGILATAYRAHEMKGKLALYGHVKAEKIAHMVEAYVGIDLGRTPVKDAAGPNDYPHLKRVEHRARMARYFDFTRVNGAGYRVKKLRRFDALVEETRERLGDRSQDVGSLLDLMVSMDTQQAEIFSTVYAAWNNLLLDNRNPTDEEIVFEARENWHPEKLKIPRGRFFAAIRWLKEKGIVPTGQGRMVAAKARTL